MRATLERKQIVRCIQGKSQNNVGMAVTCFDAHAHSIVQSNVFVLVHIILCWKCAIWPAAQTH